MNLRLVLLLCLSFLPSANTVASDTHAGRTLNGTLGCVRCHGEEGLSEDPLTPNLAGQDRHYLAKQLRAFARAHEGLRERTEWEEGGRSHWDMDTVAMALTRNAIDDLAVYYSRLPCVTGFAREFPPPPRFGRACVGCHGPGGINITPAMPDLGGQKKTYLVKEMRSFRASLLGSVELDPGSERFDPVMAGHGVRLKDSEIEILASYFSTVGCREQ